MKKIYVSLFILSVTLVLFACGDTASPKNKSEAPIHLSDQSSEKTIKEIEPFTGIWKYEILDGDGNSDQRFLDNFFNMELKKDGNIILTYNDHLPLGTSLENLSKEERIRNNVTITRATYAIDLNKTNVNDSYENNTHLFENIHPADGGWDWDFNLLDATDENDTNLFLANLVNIELEAYFPNDNQNTAYWKQFLVEESVKDRIAQGSIEILEESNNYIKLNYRPSLSDNQTQNFIFTDLPKKELLLFTLSDKVMTVNLYHPDGLGTISNLIREGVNPESLLGNRYNNLLNGQQIIN